MPVGSAFTQEPTQIFDRDRDFDTDEKGIDLPHHEVDRPVLMRLIGQLLHHYQIESLLGRGGMGWVFLARNTSLQRPCALKILAPTLAARDSDYVKRFQHEGRAAASLVHPNIVTTHAIGSHDGFHYLEMEFLRGRSLTQRLRHGPLNPVEALALAATVSGGLAVAHRNGVVHRDLKPDNILLTHQGHPKITDFGLAKLISRQEHRTIAGTPQFMAPELFRGEPPTPASDIYALGVTLFVMLTGQCPYPHSDLKELMYAVTHTPLPSLRKVCPGLSLDIAECVCQMLSKAPENRPADGFAAQQLLRAVLGHARDLETLLHEALDSEPRTSWKREGRRYEARVELENGRWQRVYLENSDHRGRERVLSVYSICGPATPDFYAEALRLNAEIVHGALAVREIDGIPHFVMLNNYPRATVDAEEIRRSILDAAYHGDAVERRLSGGRDDY